MPDTTSPRRPHRHLDADVAAMLADARAALGWTVAVAASRIGVSGRMLRYLEAAQRAPSTAVADAVVSAYGLGNCDAELLRSAALPGVGRSSPYHT